MLSFELKKPRDGDIPDELEVHIDIAGLESLLAQLRFLRERRTEHVHLMSETWGGTHLDNRPQNADATTIHHVKFLLR
jgi:hypothetical protein